MNKEEEDEEDEEASDFCSCNATVFVAMAMTEVGGIGPTNAAPPGKTIRGVDEGSTVEVTSDMERGSRTVTPDVAVTPDVGFFF